MSRRLNADRHEKNKQAARRSRFYAIPAAVGGTKCFAGKSSLSNVRGLLALLVLAIVTPAHAQKKYDQGATDAEIKIGTIMPYSGPLSSMAGIGRTEEAYFRMINEQGGINGRKIVLISYDDAYSPLKTVEQARKLVESDEVFAIVSPVGTPTNAAIQKYMNTRKVPHLFVLGSGSRFADPKNSLGRSVCFRARRSKLVSTPDTSLRRIPDAKIEFFTRTTISERSM